MTTLYALDDLAAGDVIVATAPSTTIAFVEKAVTASLIAKEVAYGVVRFDVAEGARVVAYKRGDAVPRAVSGLAADANGPVRVDPTTGRAELVEAFAPDDWPLGEAVDGELTLDPRTRVSPNAGFSSLDVGPGLTATGTVAVTIALDEIIVARTGANRGAAINAAIVTANAAWLLDGVRRTVRLEEAAYEIEERVDVLSGVTLLFPTARLVPAAGWVPDEGDADDPENCLIRCASTVGDELTTVATTHWGGSKTIDVDDSIAPGTWVLFHSVSPTTDIYVTGSAVEKEEVAKVVEVSGSGPYTLTLDRKLMQVHGQGTSVIELPDGVVQDAEIIGGDIALEGRTFAVGVLVSAANRVRVDVEGAGASRGVVHVRRGSRGCKIDFVSRGQNNAGVYLESSHLCSTRFDWDTSTALGRTHDNGVPRGLYTEKHRCYFNKLTGSVGGGCTGLLLWGSMGGHYDVLVEDCLLTERIGRDPDMILMVEAPATYGGGSGVEILGVQTGVAEAEIPYSTRIRVTCIDCRTPDKSGNQGAIFVVNSRDHTIEHKILNLQRTWDSTADGEFATGLVIFDCDGLNVPYQEYKGVRPALSFFGGWIRAHFGKTHWDPANAQDGADLFAFWGLYGNGIVGGQPISIIFDDVEFVDEPAFIFLRKNDAPAPEGSAFEIAAHHGMLIQRYSVENKPNLGGRSVRFVVDGSATSDNGLARGACVEQRPPVAGTIDTGTNAFTSVAHGFPDGVCGYIRASSAPTGAGYATGTLVYVVGRTADTLQFALTNGGAAIDWSGAGADVEFQPINTVVGLPTNTRPDRKLSIVGGVGWGFGFMTPARVYLAAEEGETKTDPTKIVLTGDALVPKVGSTEADIDNASTAPWRIAMTAKPTAVAGAVGARRA